jgi:hypothetical protein
MARQRQNLMVAVQKVLCDSLREHAFPSVVTSIKSYAVKSTVLLDSFGGTIFKTKE